MTLSTNYCPYCGREIPQFPKAQMRPGQYCFDDCPEGEGKRIEVFPKIPVPVARPKKDYTPGLGAFKDPAELTGLTIKPKRRRKR